MTTIVPAFFAIEADADRADTIAGDLTTKFNTQRRELERAQSVPGYLPQVSLRLCEASPTTELDGCPIPETLEGLTCDSGSDRSATALVQRIAEIGADSTKAIPVAFTEILQLAQGWLRQRMTLHPQASTEPAPGIEKQSAAELLLHAFACAEANASHVDPWKLKEAIEQAKAEHPGTFEQLVELYQQQGGLPHG